MIGRLNGILADKQPPHLLIDVGGVGYEVDAPMSTIYQLPEVGEPVQLYTHLVVREDFQQLYGFARLADRRLFRDLIKVSGIGAKMALAILSGMDTETLIATIVDGDARMLVSIPGIGRKSAERLIVEMKDRLANWSMNETASSGVTPSEAAAISSAGDASQARGDAIDALVSLGYKPQEAMKLVKKALEADENMSREEIIRMALQSVVS